MLRVVAPSPRRRALRLAGFAAAVAAGGCGHAADRLPAEEAVRQRQHAALESLLAEPGPLVPFERVLVIVDQELVQHLLASAVPYEQVIGRYRVRVTGASVRFEDGFALVRLDGRASVAEGPGAAAFADVSIYGGLDVVEIDPDAGLLRGAVTVIAVDVRRLAVLGLGAPEDAASMIEELGRERLEAFSVLASRLEIPVRLERAVTLPGVGPEGGVRIAPAEVPLELGLTQVRALRGKLWVSVHAAVGSAAGQPP